MPLPLVLASVAIAAVAGGTAMTVLGNKKSAAGARRAGNISAVQAIQESQERLRQLEIQRNKVLGMQRAGFAARGVKINVGTPMVVIAETNSRAREAKKRIQQQLIMSIISIRSGVQTQTAALKAASIGAVIKGVGSIAQIGLAATTPAPAAETGKPLPQSFDI